MKCKFQQRLELAVRLVDHREDFSELETAADRLHAQMILFVNHEAQTLRGIHDHRAAYALGGMLPTDQVPFDQHLLLQRRQRLQIFCKGILHHGKLHDRCLRDLEHLNTLRLFGPSRKCLPFDIPG
jgi:hypothetical protein